MLDKRMIVQVGVPTYNRAQKLKTAVESVLVQNYRALSVLISDNGSTDSTQDYCRQLQAVDSRVMYSRHPTNIGPTANHRAVRAVSDCDLYLVIGDDDWLEQDYVSQCVEALRQRPDLALVCGKPILHRDGSAEDGTFENILDDTWSDRVARYYATVQENHFYHGIMRREILAAVPPMPNALAGDWRFLASIAALGKFLTLETTAVHMSKGGMSSAGETDRERFATTVRVLGLPKSHVYLPWVRICLGAIGDVLYANRVFRTKPLPERIVLSLRIAAVFNRRFFYPRSRHALARWARHHLPGPVVATLRTMVRIRRLGRTGDGHV